VPATKEPTGRSRSDGRRPDGMTLIPWQNGKALTWDVTVATTLADSYISASARSAGATAELAVTRKITKYCNLLAEYMFQPIALETLRAINSSAGEFLVYLGRKISGVFGETKEGLFLFQRLSIVLQRFNATLVRERFYEGDEPNK